MNHIVSLKGMGVAKAQLILESLQQSHTRLRGVDAWRVWLFYKKWVCD